MQLILTIAILSINYIKGILIDFLLLYAGTVGDWKNYFTVADDELFDSILAKWSGGKDIPFRYTL